MDTSHESSLKISNIQSLTTQNNNINNIKQEKQPMEESTIKIRTISEINQSHSAVVNATRNVLISKQHPAQLSKNIVVRKVPNQVAPPINPAINRPSVATNGIPKVTNYVMPPALEAYIKELEEQNKEMKKILLECRREAVSIQMRTHKLTNLINATVSKCNAKRPVTPLKQILSQINPPQHIQQSMSPPLSKQQVQHQSPLLQKKQFKLVPKKGTNNIISKGNIICRMPVFPIKTMQTLKQLELDLSKKEFSEYVFQKLYSVNNKPDIDKPSVLLNQTLNSIMTTQLMGHFQYNEKTSDSADFKALQRIRVLYGKLVNSLSNAIFSKSVDMQALEKFVKNKISSHRNEYLANVERLKATKLAENNRAEPVAIKEEKVESDERPLINVVDNNNQLRWPEFNNDDEPMQTEENFH